MELDETYNLNFLYVEGTVAQAYREGIKKLRNHETPNGELKVVLDMFDALGQSHPLRSTGVEWASEIIPAYKNIARILKEIPNQEYDITSLFSRYTDLFDGYKEGLSIEKESRATQLEKAIKDLSQVKRILNEHNYDTSELDVIFEKLGELEYKIKEHDQISTKLEEL